jgi:hypothetical protein
MARRTKNQPALRKLCLTVIITKSADCLGNRQAGVKSFCLG